MPEGFSGPDFLEMTQQIYMGDPGVYENFITQTTGAKSM